MAIRHISFRRDMQEAIDAGTKTMTRRPVKPQPVWDADGGCWYPARHHKRARHYANEDHFRRGMPLDFPRYSPGDRFVVLDRACEITAVRVERVQSISDADVRAEGISEAAIDKWRQWLHPNDCAGHAFSEIWDLKYRKTFPWASNCYVWRVTFRRIET